MQGHNMFGIVQTGRAVQGGGQRGQFALGPRLNRAPKMEF